MQGVKEIGPFVELFSTIIRMRMITEEVEDTFERRENLVSAGREIGDSERGGGRKECE